MAHVITAEHAVAQGIGPASLRQVAAWNLDTAEVEMRRKLRDGRDVEMIERRKEQGATLLLVADQVERLAARTSRRRAA